MRHGASLSCPDQKIPGNGLQGEAIFRTFLVAIHMTKQKRKPNFFDEALKLHLETIRDNRNFTLPEPQGCAVDLIAQIKSVIFFGFYNLPMASFFFEAMLHIKNAVHV